MLDSTGQKIIILMESDRQWQGIFLHLFCTKNKLMKSFKFTGISICCFISHRFADNPTCGEVQHFVFKQLQDPDRLKQADSDKKAGV